MKNNVNKVSMNTGGHVSTFNRDEESLSVKITGELKEEKKDVGLAKASPKFKEVKPEKDKEKSKAEKEEAIKNNEIKESE